MNCATRFVKYILFVFNFCCVILGCILLSFGIWMLNNAEEVRIDHGEKLLAILTIVLGSTVLIVAFFGCVGAFMEARGMLISYAVILVILLVIQLVLLSISYAAVSGDGVPSGIQNGLDSLWDIEQRRNNLELNNTLGFYEEWLHCCGKKSPEDYFLLEQIPPPSCCKDRDCTNVLNLYMEGCEQKYLKYVSDKTSIFNAISWWLIVIEFVGSVFACVLVDSLRNHRDHVQYYS